MATENISIKLENLGKKIDEYQENLINIIEYNNKQLRSILEYQGNEKQKDIYSDLELAKDTITKIIMDI